MAFKFAGVHSPDNEQPVTIGLFQRTDDIALQCFDSAGRRIPGGVLLQIITEDGKIRIKLAGAISKDLPIHTNILGQISVQW